MGCLTSIATLIWLLFKMVFYVAILMLLAPFYLLFAVFAVMFAFANPIATLLFFLFALLFKE